MTLFQYEMKKLLFNKSRLILLALLFGLYGCLGFILASEGKMNNTSQYPNADIIYTELIESNTGAFNQDTFNACQGIIETTTAQYGKGDGIEGRMRADPHLAFAVKYVSFGSRVDAYRNGSTEQDPDNILGIYPMQEKLVELEKADKTDSYEYKLYSERLNLETQIGEPIFENAGIWSAFFVMFDWIFIIFLLLMVLTFFISPLFTQEVRTKMDSIVLCSLKGRREIVTAKLGAAALTSATLAVAYLSAALIGMRLGSGDFSGLGAHVRCLDGYTMASIDITIGALVIIAMLWLILSTIIFGLALAFISSKMKNQSAAFGIGIVVLLAGMMSANIPESLHGVLWPVIDFHFGALAMFNAIFGGAKMYNVFGMPVPYSEASFVVCLALGVLACLLTYMAQRKRSSI